MTSKLEITTNPFPYFLEVLATIVWATSGALVARAYGFDFIGVFIIVMVSTTADAMLTMLANAMMPEAFEHGGITVGLFTVLGFFASAILSVVQ